MVTINPQWITLKFPDGSEATFEIEIDPDQHGIYSVSTERREITYRIIGPRPQVVDDPRIFETEASGPPPLSPVPPLTSTDEIFEPARERLTALRDFETTVRAAIVDGELAAVPDGRVVRLPAAKRAAAFADPDRCGVCGSALINGRCPTGFPL